MKNEAKKLDYDIGEWDIDEEGNFIRVHDPFIDLSDDVWVTLDVDGDFCRVMTHAGEIPTEEAQSLITEYAEAIEHVQAQIAAEYAEGYRDYLLHHDIDGEVDVVDSDWLSVNGSSAYVELLATPLSHIHIVKLITPERNSL